MTETMNKLYGLAAKTGEDESHALDEIKAPDLRRAEARVRDDMDVWVRDRVAAITHALTGHGPGAAL